VVSSRQLLLELPLRRTRDAALFHQVGAATPARSTLIRMADQAKIAISRCADDPTSRPPGVVPSFVDRLFLASASRSAHW
jgi:hypothetical protein